MTVNVAPARLNGSDDVEITMYPNPTSAILNVTVRSYPAILRDTTTSAVIEVLDVVGKLVYRWEGESAGAFVHLIDLGGNAEGQYLVKISVGDEVVTKVISLVK